MGGGLPPRHRHWVLHDVTTKRWRWRALFRSVIQILPVAVLLFIFLPTQSWVALMAVGGGLLVGMIYAVAYLDESTEHRALKAGFTRGTASRIRGDVDIDELEEDERYYRRDRDDGPATPDNPG
jgi:Family of unknown function (DUF5313)